MRQAGQVHPQFQAALEPVLRDLRSCTVQPIVEPWPGEGGVAGVWFREADGSGAVVEIRVRGRLEEEIVDLADRVQDWAGEALNAARQSPVWPECPRHPDSHPVEARLIGDEPTWVCPVTSSRSSG